MPLSNDFNSIFTYELYDIMFEFIWLMPFCVLRCALINANMIKYTMHHCSIDWLPEILSVFILIWKDKLSTCPLNQNSEE